jgi:hypothetical protein
MSLIQIGQRRYRVVGAGDELFPYDRDRDGEGDALLTLRRGGQVGGDHISPACQKVGDEAVA